MGPRLHVTGLDLTLALGKPGWPFRSALLVGLHLAFVGACSAPSAPAAAPGDANGTDVDAGDAGDASPAEDSTPCPSGQALVEEGRCAAVGPPACATLTDDALLNCVPRWCGRWVDGDNKACAVGESGCRLESTACDSVGAVSCGAGDVPDVGGGCRRAGSSAGPDKSWPTPRWCADGPDAPPRACAEGELGCPVGEGPDPAAAGECRPLRGPVKPCPDGFDAVGDAKDGLPPACVASATACGTSPYAVAPGPSVVFVDAAAPEGGDGSLASPFSELGPAITAAPEGGTVALTDGVYTGGQTVAKKLSIIGRCASAVYVVGSSQKPNLVLTVQAKGSVLRGLTVEGGARGIQVEGVKGLLIERVRVVGSIGRGISLTLSSSADLQDCLIEEIVPDKLKQNAHGIYLDLLTVVNLKRVRVRKTAGDGVIVRTSSKLDAVDLLVDGSNPDGVATLQGFGLRVETTSKATLRRAAFIDNCMRGIEVYAKSDVTGDRVVIERTRSLPDDFGFATGAAVGGDSVLDLRAARVGNFVGWGVLAEGPVATLRLDQCALLGMRAFTNAKGTWSGVALIVRVGGNAEVRRSIVLDTVGEGVNLDHDKSSLLLEDVIIRDVRQSGPGYGGQGVDVTGGCSLTMRRCQIEDAYETGVVASNDPPGPVSGSILLNQVDVRGIHHNTATVNFAAGVLMDDMPGRLQSVRVRGVEGGGVSIAEGTADVALADVLIEGIHPDARGEFGLGMASLGRARVNLAGVGIHDCRGVGLVLAGKQAALTADGLRVDKTGPRASDGGGGHGVYAALESTLTLRNSVIADNLATGLAVDNATATVDDCAILNTRLGPLVRTDLGLGTMLADGVVAVGAASLQVRRSLVLDNARAGLLVDAAKGVLLEATLFRGGIYGLAKQNGGDWVRKDCAVRGASLAATASDQGLAVPKAPVAGF